MKNFAPLYLLKGYKWLFKPGLRRFVLIPILINIILFGLFVGFGFHAIDILAAKLLPHYLQWLAWLADILFFICFSIIAAYVFTIVTNLIGSPFNSLLSEKVQLLATKTKPNNDAGVVDAIRDVPRVLKREVRKIWYYVPRLIVLLVLMLLPGVNIVIGLVWFLFGSWMMAVEYLDYPIDNHRISFADMLKHLHKSRWQTLFFGISVMVLAMIPIVNLFVMPAAVIGATLMYVDG